MKDTKLNQELWGKYCKRYDLYCDVPTIRAEPGGRNFCTGRAESVSSARFLAGLQLRAEIVLTSVIGGAVDCTMPKYSGLRHLHNLFLKCQCSVIC